MSRSSRPAAIASVIAASVVAIAATATPALAFTAGPFTANVNEPMTIDAGGVAASCTGSTLTGTIDAEGALTVDSATVEGCGVPVTPENLPWSGSLKDGVAQFNGFTMSAIGCTYTGDLTGTYEGTDFPVTTTFTEQTVNRTSGFLCPETVTVSVKYDFTQP